MIMSMNTRAEILQMVADGVITQEEADRLIDAGFAQKRRSHAKTSAWRWMWEGLNCCPHGMESCGPK